MKYRPAVCVFVVFSCGSMGYDDVGDVAVVQMSSQPLALRKKFLRNRPST